MCQKCIISNHFSVHQKKITNFLVSVWNMLKQLSTSVSLKVVDIFIFTNFHLYFGEKLKLLSSNKDLKSKHVNPNAKKEARLLG